ncbi:SdrD B-like domain-containing protein [Nocardioides sp. YIM 152588]|uniref:SdrD B-like domain-containing protein n=1 Tax=Nocardioides sp. YIM 152588 TaxID=3158259 RepID=UPI0032E4BD68
MRGLRSTPTIVSTILATVVGAFASVAVVAVSTGPAVAAPTNDLGIAVVSARTEPRAFGGAGVSAGDAVDQFKWMINVDNTGTTDQRSPQAGTGCSTADAGYPGSCDWPSIGEIRESSPIYAHGDETDLTGGSTLTLPDGRYLISVLADGYKIDGAHFTVPLPDTDPLQVELQPNPLPDSTLRAQVFSDTAPTNGTLDVGDAPLAGFQGHVADTLGELTTDVYGNALCTTYVGEDPDTHEIPLADLDADMLPVVDVEGGTCLSDADGLLTIPHLGPNRYALSVTPPDSETWIQTTTLEGNHDWDTWLMEGATGYDTEFVVAGEQVPQPIFGFAPPIKNGQPLDGAASGHITGTVVGINSYTPPKGGSYNYFGGNTGTKIKHPIDRPWLSLADLNGGDQAVWVGRGNANGSFDISGVPDGDYSLSWWDQPQDYNLNLINVSIRDGATENMGNIPLNGWWTEYEGYVFNDTNRNGVKDPGENGIPNFALTLRKPDNSLLDRGQNTATTDANGHYWFEAAYPLGSWIVMEAYNDLFYTTGVTYQADNQPQQKTIKGAGVDLSVMPIIGLGGRIDWGVHAYDPTGAGGVDPRNGGIVGTVSYDTTRNETDPQYAAAEDWQPSVPNIPVELYTPVDCGTTPDAPCDETGFYELDADGSYKTGDLINTYLTETWQRPTGCTARDVDGNPLVHGVDEKVLATDQETTGECISSFMQGIQTGAYPTDQGTADANFGASVDGNYGFGDGCFDGTLDATDPSDPVCDGGSFTALPAGDYLVRLAIPDDASGDPRYQATGEEDINIGNGDQIIPQVPPPACAGPLHTVDVAGVGTDGYPEVVGDGTDVPLGVTVPASTPVDNPTFAGIDGSPFEGLPEPRCETKFVELNNGKSIAPTFNIFTDVPIPSRLRGLIVDDINFSADPRSVMYGEKAGVPFTPVGIYDYQNRLVQTLESDFNGVYDVLLPSTNHISCPTPSGMCANMYRFVANDPGVPGRLNPNWNPRYRTIATEFEALPGVEIPTDLAPTQVGLKVESPSTGQSIAVGCPQPGSTPQLFAVSQPYVDGSGSFSIEGTGFGGTAGTVTLDGTEVPTSGWTSTHIDVTVPAGTPVGPHQLRITGSNGAHTVNGLTFHVLGAGYSPTVREVGPGHTYATIQAALDAAHTASADDLVVVYPGQPDLSNPRNNPRGAYYENLIMASPVKLQGVGPGGFQGSTFVPGSIIDASAFGGDTQLATDWYTAIGGLQWDGNQAVSDGEAVYVLASENATTAAGRARQFTSGYKAAIDGFDIRGGDQQGFPGNINDLTGGPTGLPPGIVTQGGAIFANAYARYLQITNNVVDNNGGAYGTIRLGTPDLAAPDTNQHNENITIADNRIIANAGTNLAGGIGVFAGADNYDIARNDICGNFSLEYGGGVSVYGRSPGGRIHHNRIYLNESNDEGGGIMIAGQLPANPDDLSPGSGPVDIYANTIQANLANDDGGGIRFLMAGGAGGTDEMNVVNNTIANNVSTHEGGGVALDDAPNVRIVNNTIMKNLTTATAVTSDGQPVAAGVSSTSNSDQLQATLPGGAPSFSDPTLFNNVFWDNRAGTRAGTSVTGIGLTGDPSPVDHWDVGVAGGTGQLSPTSSIVQQDSAEHPYTTSPSNSGANPSVVDPYDLSVSFATWRQNPAFVDATLVTLDLPPEQMGDYHLSGCPASPACNLGAASSGGVDAPATDIDDESRPALGGFDAGSDEVGGDVTPPPASGDLYFSTIGNVSVPGVGGTPDDADVYTWDGTAFARDLDLSAAPYSLPGAADLDGFGRVDDTHFFASFRSNISVPGLGTVADEDVVYWDDGTWTPYFDGSAHGLGQSGQDVEAINFQAGVLYFSTSLNINPDGVGGTPDDSDLYAWDGDTVTRAWDATANGVPASADVDGVVRIDDSHLYVSFAAASTTLPGVGTIQDEDVVAWDGAGWSMFFDGTAAGLTAGGLDLDAISFAASSDAAPPPPPPPPPGDINLYLSTVGNANPPGVGGAADDADVHGWDGNYFTRELDLSAAPYGLPAGADTDGFSWLDGTQFYASFAGNTNVPGLGTVQDEDVVLWNGSAWSVSFDGTSHGLGQTGQDVDAVSVVGGVLYFSTVQNTNPAGVGGAPDDSDIYSWDGSTMARVWDASANGVPGGADVDGLDLVDPSHFYLSFWANASLPQVGTTQDEDVVEVDGGTWSTYFDGTAHGLTTFALDVDALDVP